MFLICAQTKREEHSSVRAMTSDQLEARVIFK